jgi:hypothetical protein
MTNAPAAASRPFVDRPGCGLASLAPVPLVLALLMLGPLPAPVPTGAVPAAASREKPGSAIRAAEARPPAVAETFSRMA